MGQLSPLCSALCFRLVWPGLDRPTSQNCRVIKPGKAHRAAVSMTPGRSGIREHTIRSCPLRTAFPNLLSKPMISFSKANKPKNAVSLGILHLLGSHNNYNNEALILKEMVFSVLSHKWNQLCQPGRVEGVGRQEQRKRGRLKGSHVDENFMILTFAKNSGMLRHV